MDEECEGRRQAPVKVEGGVKGTTGERRGREEEVGMLLLCLKSTHERKNGMMEVREEKEESGEC